MLAGVATGISGRILVAGLISLVVVASAGAQAPFPEGMTRKLLQLALENIHRGRCENFKPCDPATPQEKANPPLTLIEAQQVIDRAVLSGAAMHCKLDWQNRNFTPMMAYWRGTQRKTERQMALVGLIHGIVQGMIAPSAERPSACPEEMRKGLEARLDFVS
jgi:hypothetical protein